MWRQQKCDENVKNWRFHKKLSQAHSKYDATLWNFPPNPCEVLATVLHVSAHRLSSLISNDCFQVSRSIDSELFSKWRHLRRRPFDVCMLWSQAFDSDRWDHKTRWTALFERFPCKIDRFRLTKLNLVVRGPNDHLTICGRLRSIIAV